VGFWDRVAVVVSVAVAVMVMGMGMRVALCGSGGRRYACVLLKLFYASCMELS
jgi:hypothetical protein